MAIDLRSFSFIDSLQPQLTAFMSSTCRGYFPITNNASLWIEVAPGIAINRVTDIAIKKTQVRPAVQIVERAYGVLEIHHESQAEVLEAGRHVLEHLKLKETDRLRPVVMTSEIITHIDDYQAMLINNNRNGSMFVAGQTLYVLEVHPAAYACIAANEAEKASPITLIHAQPYGAFGRLQLSGSESHIEEARKAVHKALENIEGRDNQVKGGG